ncbi:MAG TPA: MutS2/Smr-associated SH3 domain-containing protein, partial [Anaerolineae bacterium]|nr:MutS2/Smr-associated SH3 domain-containing protein [Anaerolineae bacterium]
TERAPALSVESDLEDRALPGDIQVGDTVWVRGLNTNGQVTGLDGSTVEVQVGRFGVRVEKRSWSADRAARPRRRSARRR